MFENPEQAIIMFGGLQDAANLYASYDIRVECMVDLQGMFFSYHNSPTGVYNFHTIFHVIARVLHADPRYT